MSLLGGFSGVRGTIPNSEDLAPTRRQLGWLTAIVACGISLRLAALYWQMSLPTFGWSNPDQYLSDAASLTQSGSWVWTVSAIQYNWGGVTWLLPPGYPVFLSLFYRADSASPFAAAIAQCLVGGATTIPMFFLARALHNVRAGLVAAFIWAIWFSGMSGVNLFVQEQLYIPLLVLALAVLAVCLRRQGGLGQFVLAGVCLGLASLTRAMPLFFMVGLVPLVWLFGPTRKAGLHRSLALLAGFLLLVAPYISWVSLTHGELVLIDNHMSILHAKPGGTNPTGLWTTATAFAREISAQPGEKLDMARGMFNVYGPSWLYHHGAASTAFERAMTGVMVHVVLDTLFVFVCVLAPIGFAVARQRQVGFVLISWSAFVVAASVAAGFSGPRYRAPLEVALVCGASVLLGGRWRIPGRWIGLLGVGSALGFVLLLGSPYIKSWDARVPYGFDEWIRLNDDRFKARAQGNAGFYLPSIGGAFVFDVEPVAGAAEIYLTVKQEGVPVRTVHATRGQPTQVRLPMVDRNVTFIETIPITSTGASVPDAAYRLRAAR